MPNFPSISALVLLMGPPFVGKTTQGKILSDKFGWTFVSAQDLATSPGTSHEIDQSTPCLVIDDIQANPACLKNLSLIEIDRIYALYLVGPTESDLQNRAINSDISLNDIEHYLDQYEESSHTLIFDIPFSKILPIDARGRPEDVASRIEASLLV